MTGQGHKDFSEQDVQQRFETIAKDMVETGLYAEAIEAYKELIRDHPGSRWAANAYLSIAHCYHALGQEEEELSALEDIIAQFPDHVVAKRARGAIEALRGRHYGEGPAGADLHGAVRRLTRQVERLRQAQQRRAWLGAVVFVVLLVAIIWLAARSSGGYSSRAADDLSKRVTALESAVQAVSGGTPGGASQGAPDAASPAATVTPVAPQPTTPPAPATKAPPTPKPPPAPVRPPSTKTYTVKDGESLWTIARSQLGDGRRAEEIAELNGIKAPYNIRVGDKLKLPTRE
ncbi:MAG: LysM peptidoglycan-binding domain-containing protein [Armatimonadota bacterium]|nr:MAG: LysM peptidoglycan-binding domain-containing protein [Armatimonadota bacterium]